MRHQRQYGLNDVHSGNMPMRCDANYRITPTDARARNLNLARKK
jgi:hypothetical protein